MKFNLNQEILGLISVIFKWDKQLSLGFYHFYFIFEKKPQYFTGASLLRNETNIYVKGVGYP